MPVARGRSVLSALSLSLRPVVAARRSVPLPSAISDRLRTMITVAPKTTFGAQQSLPRLPVPPLDESAAKLLESVRPLCNDDEFARFRGHLDAFVGGVGRELQRDLEAKGACDNWLDAYWEDLAYLMWRDPLVPQETMLLADDPLGRKLSQTERLASVIAGMIEFKSDLDREAIEPDMVGKATACMEQYRRVFGGCRLPQRPKDTRTNTTATKHIVVVCRGQFYPIPVFDANNVRRSESDIKKQLEFVKMDAMSSPPQPQIGIFTALNRDIWTDARDELCKSRQNREALAVIQSALFVARLDDANPTTRDEWLIEGMAGAAGGNRWSDCVVQVCVNRAGRLHACMEHSGVDGGPVTRMFDTVFRRIVERKGALQETAGVFDKKMPAKLRFEATETLTRMLKDAAAQYEKEATSVIGRVLEFESFGRNLAKSASLSPDAFAQCAMISAFRRLHGFVPATYESVVTTRFKKGRTETGRTATPASAAFAHAMVRGSGVSDADKLALLRKASDAHVKYISEASQGRGVDRHFLGLRMAAVEKGIEMPAVFTDPVFQRSSRWVLSTSHLPGAVASVASAFRPVAGDGYGILYQVYGNRMVFTITSYAACKERNARDFGTEIAAVLEEMGRIAGPTAAPKSKM